MTFLGLTNFSSLFKLRQKADYQLVKALRMNRSNVSFVISSLLALLFTLTLSLHYTIWGSGERNGNIYNDVPNSALHIIKNYVPIDFPTNYQSSSHLLPNVICV